MRRYPQVGLRWKTWNAGLVLLGLVLIILSLIWLLVIFPAVAKLPVDHHRIVNFEGVYKVMNLQTQTLDEMPVNVKREQQATEVQDNVLIINQTVTATHAVAGTELPQFGLSEVLGVDRSNRQYVPGYGDMDRSGQFCFPEAVKKKSYSLWIPTSPTSGSPLEAKFTGEEDFHGLKVFTFKISELDLDIGTDAETGLSQVLDMVIKMKVEPVSGTTVSSESITILNVAPVPNMKVAVYVSALDFADVTIADLVDTAKSARTKLLWAKVYGFWLAIGVGGVLTLVGIAWAFRSGSE